jgi:hypothetical protein
VDGVTWQDYGNHLEARLADLRERVHRGSYRAQPSKRAWIPKADGRQRPLGIAALEDKIVQQAVKTVLEQIYEEDFVGFSYGFRPDRGCHDALDALWVGLTERKVSWVLDADRRGRPALQRKSATRALCSSTGVESDGMHRRNTHEARETDGDSGGNRNGQPARARLGHVGGGEARTSVEAG